MGVYVLVCVCVSVCVSVSSLHTVQYRVMMGVVLSYWLTSQSLILTSKSRHNAVRVFPAYNRVIFNSVVSCLQARRI